QRVDARVGVEVARRFQGLRRRRGAPLGRHHRPAPRPDRIAAMGRMLFVALALAAAEAAQARIIEVRVEKTEPFADGAAFGAAGAYERVWGTARGELDPADPLNQGIVNIERAPRNARGLVEYETDWFMLRPADRARGNGKILYEVNNRGRKFL